jgi:serine protein kinase
MEENDLVSQVTKQIQTFYDREGQPMSFGEYLRYFAENASQQCRGAAQYIRDTFDYFGVETIKSPVGELRRFRLFDCEFYGKVGRVAGQEEAQLAIYQLLNNFAREGRINRLILLHGPNGSAKTSLIRAIIRGMEHYSTTPAGALYHFRWLFPSEKISRIHIGFGEQATDTSSKEIGSYAHVPGEQLDAVLDCELKDHPLLLIPIEERKVLFAKLREQGALSADHVIPDYLLRGDLCPKCRQIQDALRASYGGDIQAVLRHVQVQRMPISLRYRFGVATVEPQLHVDAHEQQLTSSRGLGSLPSAIAHLALYQPQGALVDANRGLLEYNDLLKRPIDTFKYLLVTCESSQVTLDRSTLFLDTVFIGSSNEMMLDSFKTYTDFPSFKGRLELVRVPYLRRVSDEIQIYRDPVFERSLHRHLAPHTLELAALWAVLTRLRKPDPSTLTGEINGVLQQLTPFEKAVLYDRGEAPARLSSALARELQNACPEIFRQTSQDYEGRSGASAREVRTLLMNTSQRADSTCVTPLGLFEEIRSMSADRTVYEFLQREADGEYFDQPKLLQEIETFYLDLLEDEAGEAMGMVAQRSYLELFQRYVQHLTHKLRNETMLDPITGAYVRPDNELLKEVEAIIKTTGENEETFRKNLVSRIGAFVLEAREKGLSAGGQPDYARVFPAFFDRLRDDFFNKRRAVIQRNYKNFLQYMDGQELDAKEREIARAMQETLTTRFGYCDSCAKAAMAFLLQKRFQG